MQHRHPSRRRTRKAPRVPGPPSPAFVELDPDEAAKYGAFRDDVDLEDVLAAEAEPGRRGRGV